MNKILTLLSIAILDWAILLRQLGLGVIPLLPRGKVPAIPRWTPYQTELAAESQILRWWQENPAYNIGIPTGEVSGFDVIDTDSPSGIDLVLASLPFTPFQVITAKGRHFYFKNTGLRLRNSVRVHGRAIDCRSFGGYIGVLLPFAASAFLIHGRAYHIILDSVVRSRRRRLAVEGLLVVLALTTAILIQATGLSRIVSGTVQPFRDTVAVFWVSFFAGSTIGLQLVFMKMFNDGTTIVATSLESRDELQFARVVLESLLSENRERSDRLVKILSLPMTKGIEKAADLQGAGPSANDCTPSSSRP